MIQQLNKLFIDRYTKFFEDLNKNVYSLNKDDNNTYLVPVVKVGTGGITKLNVNNDVQQLNNPTIVRTELTSVLADMRVYRIAVPLSEVEVMIKNQYYFNHFFDSVLNQALNTLAKEIGSPDTLRWGTSYVTFLRPGSRTDVFTELTVGTSTDDYYELRLYTDLASNTVVTKVN